MFKKETVNPEKVDSIVGQHSRFEGTIRGKGCVRIEGEVTGSIDYQGDVVVGETARVEATVSGRNITIAGSVKGNAHAAGKLELVKGGKLLGDAEHSQLVIAPGAFFLGKSKPAGEGEEKAGRGVQKPVGEDKSDKPAADAAKPDGPSENAGKADKPAGDAGK